MAMSDCNNSSEDCKPIGSPDVDPCSPCFEPGPTSFYDTLATLSRQVCSILSSIKSWGATIAKIRNRLDALEERLDNLDEPAGACDGASEGENECLPLLLGCRGGEPVFLAAQEGFVLGAVSDGDGGFCWGRVARAGGVTGTKQVFGYTGSIQTLTIPDGVENIRIKAWGAFGQSDFYPEGNTHAAPGGGGGYTEGNLAVTAGETYAVMVGQYYSQYADLPGGTYGFGGGNVSSVPFRQNMAGGGLSGLFTGTAEIAYTDSARAILIAGGGGAGGTSSAGIVSNGFPGNAGGGMGDMRGYNAYYTAEGTGSGGGGRIGGNNHLGGLGYVSGDITGGSIVSGSTVSGGATNINGYGNPTDLDLVSNNPGGYGLVVVEFFS